jgi:hypothetical protein
MDKRDKTWAEFSTLEVAVLMQCSHVKPRNFKLKTQPKQLTGSFPLDIEQPGRCPDSGFRFIEGTELIKSRVCSTQN